MAAGPRPLIQRFGADFGEPGTGRYNVAPGQQVLTVIRANGGRRSELMHWGLIPSWAKEPSVGYKMINARAESVLEKRTYRPLVADAAHRCLVVADGFYEWLKPEDPKAPRVPMHFGLKGGEPFAFAGLWTVWSPPDGEPIDSCTIITTDANDLVAPVHDRMPVILSGPDAEDAWLGPEVDGETACGLLKPLPGERMETRRASRKVNFVKNEGPELLRAVP